MQYTLKNEDFELVINSKGAEINSFRDLKTGSDIIWNGAPSIWKFHAPVLFPHCGKIKDGYVMIEGKKCALKSNGFARDSEFKLASESQNHLRFELTENEYTLNLFPYSFTLFVDYELTSSGVKFTTTVVNSGDKAFLFSAGSHSAFKIPRNNGETLDDYEIEFENKEPLISQVCLPSGFLSVSENGDCPYSLPYGEKQKGIIPLKKDYFGNGHFFTDIKSSWVGIRNKKDGSIVKVNCKNYPNLMLWQNAGEPAFVCLEPWYGMPDADNTDHNWLNKPGLVSLAPGKSFLLDQSITYEKN